MYVVVSKLFWFFAAPSSLLVILLMAGALSMAAGYRRGGHRLLCACAVAFGLLWLFPIGEWAIMPLESRFPQPHLPDRIDGILVGSGSVAMRQTVTRRQVAPSGEVIFAAMLARRYPEARVVIAGGEPWITHTGHSESEAARAFLTELGVRADRIMINEEARNKYESARASYALARPEIGQIWLLVASARQMPRAVGAYRRAGWIGVIAYPVAYETPAFSLNPAFSLPVQLGRFDMAAREWLGLAVYWVLARTDELYPGP
jgi:uncharacterized SAM-binding protein YcdF (DUF218 family)